VGTTKNRAYFNQALAARIYINPNSIRKKKKKNQAFLALGAQCEGPLSSRSLKGRGLKRVLVVSRKSSSACVRFAFHCTMCRRFMGRPVLSSKSKRGFAEHAAA
jgi:hypothetical protein